MSGPVDLPHRMTRWPRVHKACRCEAKVSVGASGHTVITCTNQASHCLLYTGVYRSFFYVCDECFARMDKTEYVTKEQWRAARKEPRQ